MKKSDLGKYMATIGSKGGRATGGAKARGSAKYYAELGRKSARSKLLRECLAAFNTVPRFRYGDEKEKDSYTLAARIEKELTADGD